MKRLISIAWKVSLVALLGVIVWELRLIESKLNRTVWVNGTVDIDRVHNTVPVYQKN
ncbi:MAG: hypothetical protein JSR77_16150 [Planctomycetes bacterium]|nr:hypothetical protein [Planctomycetota bacterium]